MISLLPISRLIAVVAVMYALLIVLVLAVLNIFGYEQTIWASLKIALSGATGLQFLLMVWFYVGWRRLWQWFPRLNNILFPAIDGEWKIEIHWQGEGQSGVVHAEATVKQDFLRVSMEVRSPKSDSSTLITQPKRDPESGRALLYYVYLVVPKAIGTDSKSPYYRAAILKFFDFGSGELSGNYWTSKHTSGHFRLYRQP